MLSTELLEEEKPMSEMFMTMPQKTNDYYNHIISSLFLLFEARKDSRGEVTKKY